MLDSAKIFLSIISGFPTVSNDTFALITEPSTLIKEHFRQ